MNTDTISAFINSCCDIHIIISKDKEKERFQYLSEFFKKYKLAVNYKEVDFDNSVRKEHTRAVNYLNVMKQSFHTQKSFVLILESDAMFMNFFPEQLYNICNKLLNMKSEVKNVFIVNLKNENFSTTSILYPRNSFDVLSKLKVDRYKDHEGYNYYSSFIEPIKKIVKIVNVQLLMLLYGNTKLENRQPVHSGTKGARYRHSFYHVPVYDRYFTIFNKENKPTQSMYNKIKLLDSESTTSIAQFIKKTYFICNREKEKDKFDYISKFATTNFKDLQYSITCPTWKDTLTPEDIQRFDSRLNLAIMSLLMNYYHVFTEIYNTNPKDDDHFMIIESDSLFTHDFFNVLNRIYLTITSTSQKIDYDYIDIGNGMGYFPSRFGYKYSNEYSLYLTNKMRCTGGIIYKFSCIKKILQYLNQTKNIPHPIDEIYDRLVTAGMMKIYWVHPSIVIQGSQNGTMESTIQQANVILDSTNYNLFN